MYISTRSNLKVTASQAIIDGLALDGGLFVPEKMPYINIGDFINLSYNEQAIKILELFLDDFTTTEIKDCVNKAYNFDSFNKDIVDYKIFDKFGFLNLFQGPTFAFKDVALQILPYLLDTALKKNKVKDKIVILTATSGDTGSAALAGFSKIKEINTVVLYPDKGISEIQELQMLSFKKENSFPLAVNGNFDDCQRAVKDFFQNNHPNGVKLSSANSINIGRLIPQIVYYVYSYTYLVNKKIIKLGDKINFSVPTGNFGNILACYIAKQIGTPIDKIICASNKNDVLTDFFNTGVYNSKRNFYITNSPSMDILISSNLERYLYFKLNDSNKIKKIMEELKLNGKYEIDKNIIEDYIMAKHIDEEETLVYINECYKENNYIIDPHTSVAYGAYCHLKKALTGFTFVVSTASPFKFSNTICSSFGIQKLDNELANIKYLSSIFKMKLDKRFEKLENVLDKREVIEKDEINNKINKILEVLV